MPTDQRAQRPLPPSPRLSPPDPATAPAIDDAGAAAQRQLALLAARGRHWQRTRRLTFALLALWLAASFCSVFFARELAGLSLFGWPLSFYLAAQGAALIYLAILGAYAAGMRGFDRRYGRELERGLGQRQGHKVGNEQEQGKTAPGDAP